MSAPRELFISHSHFDHEVLLRLSAELTRHGVPHWFAERDIRGSQQWHDEIGLALERCDWFAVLPSPAATESIWVKREVVYGVRPEHLYISEDGRGIPAKVVVVEPTGAETMVVMHMAGQEVQAIFRERHRFEPGQDIMLLPDVEHLHLFDKRTGQRLNA